MDLEIRKYRVWCETEEANKFVWGLTAPTECPDNPAHTIDPTKTAIVRECYCRNPGNYDPNNFTLAEAKICKCAGIDHRTLELIAQGFVFAGKTFSLSQAAQSRLLGINQVRDNPAVTYPINWNTIDDSDVYPVPDSATLFSFYLTAMGTYRAHVDSGTTLKDQVRAATTKAEVEAIIDPR